MSDVADLLRNAHQARREHRLDESLQAYIQAAVIYRSSNEPLALAHTIRHVGDIQTELGALTEAEASFSEALSIYRSHPDTKPLDLANAIRGYAFLKQSAGDTTNAISLWQEAHSLYKTLNIDAGVAESTRRIADLTANS
jgi:tetratricopeptide (TPR) repeat protein